MYDGLEPTLAENVWLVRAKRKPPDYLQGASFSEPKYLIVLVIHESGFYRWLGSARNGECKKILSNLLKSCPPWFCR